MAVELIEIEYPFPNLAPRVCRQRALVEASGCEGIDRFNFIHIFLELLCTTLEMKPMSAPMLMRVPVLHQMGSNPDDYGISACQIWLESGVTIHAWPDHGFLMCNVETCKPFDVHALSNLVEEYFNAECVQVTNVLTK